MSLTWKRFGLDGTQTSGPYLIAREGDRAIAKVCGPEGDYGTTILTSPGFPTTHEARAWCEAAEQLREVLLSKHGIKILDILAGPQMDDTAEHDIVVQYHAVNPEPPF